jgi:hypothetical protein
MTGNRFGIQRSRDLPIPAENRQLPEEKGTPPSQTSLAKKAEGYVVSCQVFVLPVKSEKAVGDEPGNSKEVVCIVDIKRKCERDYLPLCSN